MRRGIHEKQVIDMKNGKTPVGQASRLSELSG
jgi:hypothetical protein